jgi:hypothetical protein
MSQLKANSKSFSEQFSSMLPQSEAFLPGSWCPGASIHLTRENTVDLNHGVIGEAFSKSGKGVVIRGGVIQGQVQKRFKRNSIIDLAFKFRIGFNLKPFLQKHAFEQKQRGIGSFSLIGLAGLIIFCKKCFNRFPFNGLIHLVQEN